MLNKAALGHQVFGFHFPEDFEVNNLSCDLQPAHTAQDTKMASNLHWNNTTEFQQAHLLEGWCPPTPAS